MRLVSPQSQSLEVLMRLNQLMLKNNLVRRVLLKVRGGLPRGQVWKLF